MILSFADKETEKLFQEEQSRKLPSNIQKRALTKLRMLDKAQTLDDVKNPPSNHLEALTGTRKGQYSIRINDKWRICFRWQDKDAYEVEIIDYH